MRSLVQRSCQETSERDLCRENPYLELLCTDLARRPLLKILYRDLVKRAEVFLGDHICSSPGPDGPPPRVTAPPASLWQLHTCCKFAYRIPMYVPAASPRSSPIQSVH